MTPLVSHWTLVAGSTLVCLLTLNYFFFFYLTYSVTWLLCSGIPLQCEIERRQQSEEEDDGENTSSSSQEFEDVGLREEKALSDSEIKVCIILCNDIFYDRYNTLLLHIVLD